MGRFKNYMREAYSSASTPWVPGAGSSATGVFGKFGAQGRGLQPTGGSIAGYWGTRIQGDQPLVYALQKLETWLLNIPAPGKIFTDHPDPAVAQALADGNIQIDFQKGIVTAPVTLLTSPVGSFNTTRLTQSDLSTIAEKGAGCLVVRGDKVVIDIPKSKAVYRKHFGGNYNSLHIANWFDSILNAITNAAVTPTGAITLDKGLSALQTT